MSGIVKSRKKALRVEDIRTEAEAMEYLKKKFPRFFQDPELVEVSAVVCCELGEELKRFAPHERVGVLASIVMLMFNMGTAAIKATSLVEKRGMKKVFCDDYFKQRNKR